MKILVLGSNSFLAKEIRDNLKSYDIRFVSKQELDLENGDAVLKFFSENEKYDFVINTSVLGGKTGLIDTYASFSGNINMFNNLLKVQDKYGYLFNFCSGAAFNRTLSLIQCNEEKIFFRTPQDYYGMSKNIIAREAMSQKNVFTFRLFGCFGPHELETRFIKKCLSDLENNENINLQQDRFFDYFSAKDVCNVLEFYMQNIFWITHKDINLVYDQKMLLSEVADKIIRFKNSNNYVIIQGDSLGLEYTGSNYKLSSLPIKLDGLDKSLKEMIVCLS